MLATTELNESKYSENNVSLQEMSLRHGFQQMQQSQPVNAKHPVTPNTMANHFFLTLDFEKVSITFLSTCPFPIYISV